MTCHRLFCQSTRVSNITAAHFSHSIPTRNNRACSEISVGPHDRVAWLCTPGSSSCLRRSWFWLGVSGDLNQSRLEKDPTASGTSDTASNPPRLAFLGSSDKHTLCFPRLQLITSPSTLSCVSSLCTVITTSISYHNILCSPTALDVPAPLGQLALGLNRILPSPDHSLVT